jgi:hypothetical protein
MVSYFIISRIILIVDAVTWKDIQKSEDPHMIPLPDAYEERLTPFQKLMLLKVLREEKLV